MTGSGAQSDPHAVAAEREARINELVTGFALNELADDELRELHGYLADANSGRDAARSAWRTLQTVTDLRAERSTAMQDTVRQRIADGSTQDGHLTGGPAASITARFMRRLGLGRAGLAPLAGPTVTITPRPTAWRWLTAGVLALVLGLGVFALRPRPMPLAVIEKVSGRVAIAGNAMGPGDALDSQPVSVADGARVAMRWPDGTRLELVGPGTVIPQIEGAAMLGGMATITVSETGKGWALGLPDARARASAGAAMVVEVGGGRSCLAVVIGHVVDGADHVIPERTCRIGAVDIPCTTSELPAFPAGPGAPLSAQQSANLPLPAAPRWNLNLTVLPANQGNVMLTWASGSITVNSAGVSLSRADGGEIRTLHPPVGWHLELDATPWSFVISLQGDVLLSDPSVPTVMQNLSTGATAISATFRSGPPLPR